MKYYIILLLAITLTGCKKDNRPKPEDQAIAKLQGVRKYKGTVINSNKDMQGNYTTVDSQWLENYEIEIYQQYENTITLRSLDSTKPSLSTLYALSPGEEPPFWCNSCVHFSFNREGGGYGKTDFGVTYNVVSDKVTKVHVSFEKAYPGMLNVTREVFELTEQ
ncbi:MAG: hypothetical protein H3C54_08355 [Taibaiella sp.]|nr:hypothetical protein [Taibaiella sp.]